MSNFYALEFSGDSRISKWAHGTKVGPVHLGEIEICPVCKNPISHKLCIPPFRISLSSAKPEKWGDFLSIRGIGISVSRRFKEIYECEHLKGIESFAGPIEVIRHGKNKTGVFPYPTPEYYFIRVPWNGANQDDAASCVRHTIPETITCNYCREGLSFRKQSRIVIEKDSWNGSDIFRTRGAPVKYMISEKLFNICEKYQFTNLSLIPANEYGYDSRRFGMLPWYRNCK